MVLPPAFRFPCFPQRLYFMVRVAYAAGKALYSMEPFGGTSYPEKRAGQTARLSLQERKDCFGGTHAGVNAARDLDPFA